jgi:hypothetical protein
MGQTNTTTSLPTGAIVAGVGGLLAIIGVFLEWASVTTSIEGGQFAGQPIPGGTESVGATGISHWTGIVALMASVAALAAAAGIVSLREAATRRTSAMVAAGAGGLALLMTIVAFLMSESIALADVPGGAQALDFARQFAEQLGVGGIEIDVGPSMGVFVTAIGGAIAVVGGVLALRGTEAQPVASGAQEPPPSGTGFETPTAPAGPQPTVPPEPPSATPPGEPPQAGETTPEPPPGDAKKPGDTTT